MINRIIARLRGKAVPAEYSGGSSGAGGWDVLWGLGKKWLSGDSIWDPMSLAEQEQAFGSHAIVMACVRKVAETSCEARLEIGMRDEDEWRPLEAHPLLDLLAAPNGFQSHAEFREIMGQRKMLTGAAFVMKLRNRSRNRIAELWPVPTSCVSPVPARSGGRLFEGFRVQGQSGVIAPEDMIFDRIADPATMGGFISPLSACLHDYRLDAERQNYMGEMLVNMKMPGLIVTTKGSMTEKQRGTAGSELNSRIGRGKRGNALVLDSMDGGSVQVVNPLGDFDWPGLTGLSETRICAAFGTPPIIIHSRAGLDKATYSNYAHARKAFYVETMAPFWNHQAGSLTHSLLRAEGEMQLEFRYRYDELPEFNEDETQKAKRITSYYSAGMISRDEARTAAGWDPDPGYEEREAERRRQEAALAEAQKPAARESGEAA